MTGTRKGTDPSREARRHREHCGGIVPPAAGTQLSVRAEAGGKTARGLWMLQLGTHRVLRAVLSQRVAAVEDEAHALPLALPPGI